MTFRLEATGRVCSQTICLERDDVAVSIGIGNDVRAKDLAYAVVDAMLGLSYTHQSIKEAFDRVMWDLGDA